MYRSPLALAMGSVKKPWVFVLVAVGKIVKQDTLYKKKEREMVRL